MACDVSPVAMFGLVDLFYFWVSEEGFVYIWIIMKFAEFQIIWMTTLVHRPGDDVVEFHRFIK